MQKLADMGNGFDQERTRLADLQERLRQGRFHLAVLGQFKRGKSSLLNALLGEELLPTAVVPLTAIPTFVLPGQSPAVKIYYSEDERIEELQPEDAKELNDFLSQFVTENKNPHNRLGVHQVEVFHPAPLLHQGVVLIDTPGIGSTFRHNTETALNFLPQCDAAMFIVSPDPPITEVEVEFLREVRSRVPRLFFILNKADRLAEDEKQETLDFLDKVLKDQVGLTDPAVFCVSAKQGLSARQKQDQLLWRQSGLEMVERRLIEFLTNEKIAALNQAVGQKAADALSEAVMKTRLALRSIRMPLEELQRRLEILGHKLEEARSERQAAGDLLSGDWKRMHDFLEDEVKALRPKAIDYLEKIIDEKLRDDLSAAAAKEAVQEAVAEAVPGFFEHQMGEMTALVKKRMTEVLQAHQARADRLIETVRKTAADLFDIPYQAPESEEAFNVVRQPYWVTHKWSAAMNPVPEDLLLKALPSGLRKSRLRKRLMEEAAGVVTWNLENLRWSIYQSIDYTFRRFGSELDQKLAETIQATHGSIQAVLVKRREQGESVSEEVIRLETALTDLMELQSDLRNL